MRGGLAIHYTRFSLTSGQVMLIFLSIVNPIDTAVQLKGNFLFCVTKWSTHPTLQSMTPYTGEVKEIIMSNPVILI